VTPRWQPLVKPLLALVALNVAVLLAWTVPRFIQQRSLASRAATLDQELALERARAAEQRARAALLESNARDEKRFLAQVVPGRRSALVPMLYDLTTLAREHGLTPRTQTYARSAVKGAPLTAFNITMPVSGTYPQVVGFLQSVERSKHFVTIDSVALSQTAIGSSASLSIAFTTYFPREDGDVEAAPR
jgi:Tfp pilus assembly protein PilO